MLIIYKASAGSGKTYNLARNYIKLLLAEKDDKGVFRLSSDRNRHCAILAITFTNKATEEMKRRIVKQLSLLANGEGDYIAGLCDEFKCSPQQISRYAENALRDLLSDFSNFNVSTIDSFFQVVLRTFAREAELTGNYDVDLDDDTAVAMGVDRMLTEINRSSEERLTADSPMALVRNWIIAYMRSLFNEGKSFNIFNRASNLTASFCKFVKNATSETYKLRAADFNVYFSDGSRIRRFTAAVEKLRQRPTNLDQIKAQWKQIYNTNKASLMVNLEKGISKLLDWSDPSSTLDSYFECHYFDRNTEEYGFKKGKYDPQLDKQIFNLIEPIYDRYGKKKIFDVIGKNIYQLGLIYEVQRNISINGNESSTILLRDTNEILSGIISEDEAPFIYERLGVRLRHFLIDEFQDTSRMQWSNLSPLVNESLSTDNDNLIIGDEKQSIYRFRNSDADLLAYEVPRIYAHQSEIRGKGVGENTNYRSAKEIVQFNNTIFSYMADNVEGVKEIYSGVVQQIKRTDLHGYVEANPFSEKEDALKKMMEHIHRQLESGYTQGDIAVLVYSHTDGAMVINKLLEDGSLNVMSEDSMKISASSSVKLIVSIMRDINRHLTRRYAPDDSDPNTRPFTTIYSRFQHFYSLEKDRVKALARAFGDEHIEGDNLDELIEQSKGSLSSLVERIIMSNISEEERKDDNIYLCAFQDVILDFSSKPGADVSSFLKWWDMRGKELSLTLPSDVDAIRVMTIHKSKGLEFPCVHIPFIERYLSGDVRSIVWFDPRDEYGCPFKLFTDNDIDDEIIPPLLPLAPTKLLGDEQFQFVKAYKKEMLKQKLDTLNVLYVGFTRAVRELIIGYTEKKEGGDSSTSALLIAAANGVDEARCSSILPEAPELLISLADKVTDGVIKIGEPTSQEQSKPEEPERMPSYFAIDNPTIWNNSVIEDCELADSPRQKGIILHKIISGIRTIGDIRRAVRRAAKRGYIPESEIEQYISTFTEAISDTDARQWFENVNRVITERPIITGNDKNMGNKKEHLRPDRIVWTAAGTIDIIDFKFGEETPNHYFKQLKTYAETVSTLYPGQSIRAFLWYPLKKQIITVVG